MPRLRERPILAAVTTPDHIRARRHSARHHEEVLASAVCGCFHCVTTFPPSAVERWTDHALTALCPRCGVDAVIGSESGYPVTPEFLARMERHWFKRG